MFVLLSFIGILVGILIARYTKEELAQGKRYFLWIKSICLIIISLILIYQFKLSWVILLGLIIGYFIDVEYLCFGLVLVLTQNFLAALIVFIFGLAYGSLLKNDKFKIILTNLILFLIPLVFLIINTNYTKEIMSFVIGILLIRSLNWIYKKQSRI